MYVCKSPIDMNGLELDTESVCERERERTMVRPKVFETSRNS